MRFPFGRFFGTLQQRVEVAGIGLSETAYGADACLPVHVHESNYFCLVLAGDYAEFHGRRHRLCRPATLVFHPAGEAHSNRFGRQGGTCFNVEFGADWTQRLRTVAPALAAPAAFTDPATTLLAMRLRRELHQLDDVSALAIESLALELLVAAARKQTQATTPRRPPPWLQQAEELIRERLCEPLRLHEIAAAANRHPVHLAREFRRHHGCTIGEYVRRLRVDSACRLLAGTAEPLVMVALACGFANQAHFCTCFKRAMGVSPRRYRDTFRVR